MRSHVHIWPEEPAYRDDVLEVRIRLEAQGEAPKALWYRLPAEHRASVTESMDPFVLGTIFFAMRRSTGLYVHGCASPSLLRNLEEFQAAWNCWRPGLYRSVEIHADTEREEASAPGDRAVMMFSGGLDSCFTARRHTIVGCGRRRRNLEAGLMVHGFDIPLDEPDVFLRAAENSRKIVESVGLELVPVACNFRDLKDDWEEAHGAVLASCLHLFRRRFSTGLVASSHVYSVLRFPWGSNPVTDHLLSSDGLSIVYDGGEFSRGGKAREVAAWDEAMKRMRVCWEGEHKDDNCGGCSKCVATAIYFAVEQQRIPASLHIESLDAAIRRLDSVRLKPVAILRYAEMLEAARAARIKESWVTGLDTCLKRQRRKAVGPLAKLRRILGRRS